MLKKDCAMAMTIAANIENRIELLLQTVTKAISGADRWFRGLAEECGRGRPNAVLGGNPGFECFAGGKKPGPRCRDDFGRADRSRHACPGQCVAQRAKLEGIMRRAILAFLGSIVFGMIVLRALNKESRR
jgi:hypothetical protein